MNFNEKKELQMRTSRFYFFYNNNPLIPCLLETTKQNKNLKLQRKEVIPCYFNKNMI